MKIILGADHSGTELKEYLKHYLKSEGCEYEDVSPEAPEGGDDYCDYALLVAEKVAADPNSLGVLVCDTGIGMSIAANKVNGARAALVIDTFTARRAKEHNNANILVLGNILIDKKKAVDALIYFMEYSFSEAERHLRRLNKIKFYEEHGARLEKGE